MFRRFTAILPSASPRWEVWSCPAPASAVRLTAADGPALPGKIDGKTVIALPAKLCRTLAMRVPSQDPKTVRLLASAQLEKRGLTAATAEQTAFECYPLPQPDGTSILSVDVIAAGATGDFAALKPSALVSAARCYTMPDGVLVLAEEHGRLVLRASREGVLIHSHLVSASRLRLEQLAVEIHLTRLTLEQQELLPAITSVECWNDPTDEETRVLSAALGIPVGKKDPPAPDPALIDNLSTSGLLPATGRAAARGRRMHAWKGVAAGAAALLLMAWGFGQYRALAALENQAQGLQAAIDSASGSQSEEKALTQRVRATQERWQGLRMALEPRRYPLIHLNGVTRCLGEGSVVLSRFESKGPELAVSGTAQTAGEAYSYFSAITADSELRIYDWSMVQPVIAANGSASFQIKGKMR